MPRWSFSKIIIRKRLRAKTIAKRINEHPMEWSFSGERRPHSLQRSKRTPVCDAQRPEEGQEDRRCNSSWNGGPYQADDSPQTWSTWKARTQGLEVVNTESINVLIEHISRHRRRALSDVDSVASDFSTMSDPGPSLSPLTNGFSSPPHSVNGAGPFSAPTSPEINIDAEIRPNGVKVRAFSSNSTRLFEFAYLRFWD